jgi:hypothetical protein
MQNGIIAKAFEQTEDIVNGKRKLPAANQLHSFAAMEINAGNNHRVL